MGAERGHTVSVGFGRFRHVPVLHGDCMATVGALYGPLPRLLANLSAVARSHKGRRFSPSIIWYASTAGSFPSRSSCATRCRVTPRTAANCSRLTYSITPRLRPWTPSIIPANVAP
jgi:hypothetical protein